MQGARGPSVKKIYCRWRCTCPSNLSSTVSPISATTLLGVNVNCLVPSTLIMCVAAFAKEAQIIKREELVFMSNNERKNSDEERGTWSQPAFYRLVVSPQFTRLHSEFIFEFFS